MPLTATGLVHRYGDGPPIIDGLSFEAANGESVAIEGPSGSGKTTLLSILGGLLAPLAGAVHLDGERVRPGSAVLRDRVSWVFQGSNVLLARSVLDNVVLRGLAIGLGRAVAEREALVCLDHVGLRGAAAQRADRLSGGELQRTCIARAMIGTPAVVCSDEPTGNLDERASSHVAAVLAGAASRGSVVLIVTHDPHVASVCDRRLLLVDGQLRGLP